MRKNSTHKFWDSMSKKYDGFISKYAKKTYARSIELMRQEMFNDLTVLEIGTGTGLISFALADKVKEIKAIDYSPQMINVAREKLDKTTFNNIEFRVNSITEMEFNDNSFDVIIASNIFHLLPDPAKAMAEVKRLLADDGKIILPTYCHGQNIRTKLLSLLTGLSGFKVENRWSVEQFNSFVINQGFNIVKQEVIKDKFPMSFIVATKNYNHG